jgi:hypothetical protein
MNLTEKFNKKILEAEEKKNKQILEFETSKKNGPGPGKKYCKGCNNYIGARTQICKCGFSFAGPKQQELPITIGPIVELKPIKIVSISENPEFVYEHLRLDTWEKEQAERIIAKKDILNETRDERFFAPTGWRPICKTIPEVLNRTGIPWSTTLKENTARIIVKCIPLNNFKPCHNPKLGMDQEMIAVELIEI